MKMSKILLITLVAIMLSTSVIFAADLKDLENEGESYLKAIDELASKGVISGYEDGTFKPSNTITRAEFAKMIVTAFNLKMAENSTFKELSDVESCWAQDYINIATSLGIVNGYEDGTFKPNNTITYGEISAVLSRQLGLKIEEKGSKEWFAPYWSALSDAGIFDGVMTNDFVGIGNARRDNVALLIYNSINYKKPEEAATPTEQKETQKEESKETATESKSDFTVDTKKIYFGRVDTSKYIRGKNFIDIINFNDDTFQLNVTSDKNIPEDGSLLIYKLRASKTVNTLKEIKIEDLEDAYVIEELDDEEDGVFKIKGLNEAFDISEDDYVFDGNQIKLGKATYFTINVHKKKGTDEYEFVSGEETDRFKLAFAEKDRIVVEPEKKVFVLIKGMN